MRGALILALLAITGCEKPVKEYSLLFAGDIILARSGAALTDTSSDPWGDLADIRKSMAESVFVANLESPFGSLISAGGESVSDMNLCAPVDSVELLRQVDLDLVTNQNNHAQDCAQAGTDLTSQTLQQAGISGQNGLVETVYSQTEGMAISFIAVDVYSGNYDLEDVKHLIEEAKSNKQLVVVSLHWGMEYQGGPTRNQEDLAMELVDAGADILWGHHPHVLQRMEWLTSHQDGHTALVMYSLGNLLADQWMIPDAQKTAVVRVKINRDRIIGISVVPLEMDFESKSLRIAKGEVRESICSRLKWAELPRQDVEVNTWQPGATPGESD